MGYIQKALDKGYLEHPGLHAVLTTCLRFSSLLDGARVPCCLFLSTGSYHVYIQIHSTGCCFPWVQVTRQRPGSQAKKPRTAGSQQHACTHKEHDILTTAEATAFAAQFWDQKTHPTKASQHENRRNMSLSTNRGMSALMGSQPCLKKGMLTMTVIQSKNGWTVQCHVCVHRPMCCATLKNVTPPPPTHTFLKWRFLADFKSRHIPPPR